VYYVRLIYRYLFKRHSIRPVTQEQLNAVPEKPIVIIVPAWDEANVIGRMLLNTINTVLYKNYTVFVGTYPNDEATKFEVEKIREVYPNIEVVVTPANGPTNKADCLNWIYQGIRVYERDHNTRFEIFLFHDAEDIIHPLSLKYCNFLMPRIPFVQLPVFPLEQGLGNFTVGMYMDEFAENHTKDLRAREILAQTIPSAGVGTALSSEAMDYLARLHKNQLFDIRSLTEDYMMGMSLKDMPGRKILLQQAVQRTEKRRHWRTGKIYEVVITEQIATREFFPTGFWAAVHQKSRWILGIALQGWSYGWSDSFGMNYFLYRDRKSIVANLLTIAGYIVVLYWFLSWQIGAWFPARAVPPLVEPGEVWYLLMTFVLVLLLWRLANRILAVWRIYGPTHAALSIPRLFYGNLLNFCATVKAIHRYVKSRVSGRVPAWGKTAHAYPTEAQLRTFHRKLGDLLLEKRFISLAQLETALATQKASGGKLGDILIEMGAVWEEDVVSVLATQRNMKAVELDPAATSAELLGLVPRSVAVKHRVYPLQLRDDTLILATDQEDHVALRKALSQDLTRPVAFRMTSTADITFAVERGYSATRSSPRTAGPRLGEHLVRSGRLKEEDLRKALRTQKRTGKMLGEVLVELSLMTRSEVEEELKQL
jgi:adsorption protein B